MQPDAEHEDVLLVRLLCKEPINVIFTFRHYIWWNGLEINEQNPWIMIGQNVFFKFPNSVNP